MELTSVLCRVSQENRCAVIMLTSSAVRSTLDSSMAPDWMVPATPLPGLFAVAPPVF